jgi:hypothetical protein
LIRSRRRQALLRVAGSTTTRRSVSGRKSFDPTALPRQRRHRGSRALNDLREIRQDPRSVSFDLERLFLVSRSVLRRPPPGHPRGKTAKHRDATLPHSGTPQKRLVYCSLHDVSLPDVATRRSVRCRLARAIGQEGSHP